jgi:hypothetical protein
MRSAPSLYTGVWIATGIDAQNLSQISLLSTTGKLYGKNCLKIFKDLLQKRLLNASQFGFRARHSRTLQCMRLTDHVTLNFNNNVSQLLYS